MKLFIILRQPVTISVTVFSWRTVNTPLINLTPGWSACLMSYHMSLGETVLFKLVVYFCLGREVGREVVKVCQERRKYLYKLYCLNNNVSGITRPLVIVIDTHMLSTFLILSKISENKNFPLQKWFDKYLIFCL